jgi:hypothetical protein
MKILALIDLHLEFGPLTIGEHSADVVVLAGDIHLKTRGVQWARETFKDRPVIMVFVRIPAQPDHRLRFNVITCCERT